MAQNLIRANNISIVTRRFEQLQCFGPISSCFYWNATLCNACEIDAGAGRQMGRCVWERYRGRGREKKGRLKHTHADLPLVLLTPSEKSTRSRGQLDKQKWWWAVFFYVWVWHLCSCHFIASYHKHQAKGTEISKECLQDWVFGSVSGSFSEQPVYWLTHYWDKMN